MESELRIIGLVGGVASGKSSVAAQFEQLGAQVIDGDRLGHEALKLSEIMEAARKRWGDGTITTGVNHGHSTDEPQPQLDRAFIAQRVFASTEQGRADLEFWEKVTHPRITQALESELSRLPAGSIVVLDAAVMFKAGWDGRCEEIIFVDVPEPERRRRAIENRGWSGEHFRQREASQMPVNEKRRRANTVIDNSGTLEETYAQVLAAWKRLSDPRKR